jgi:hypothetical protein
MPSPRSIAFVTYMFGQLVILEWTDKPFFKHQLCQLIEPNPGNLVSPVLMGYLCSDVIHEDIFTTIVGLERGLDKLGQLMEESPL